MSIHVLGVGLGVFIVLLLWTASLLICFVFWKSKGPASFVGFGFSSVALLITIVLLFIPKAPETSQVTSETKVYDDLYIGRIILVIIMGVFAVTSFALLIFNHWMQASYATPLKQVK